MEARAAASSGRRRCCGSGRALPCRLPSPLPRPWLLTWRTWRWTRLPGGRALRPLCWPGRRGEPACGATRPCGCTHLVVRVRAATPAAARCTRGPALSHRTAAAVEMAAVVLVLIPGGVCSWCGSWRRRLWGVERRGGQWTEGAGRQQVGCMCGAMERRAEQRRGWHGCRKEGTEREKENDGRAGGGWLTPSTWY